MVLFGWVFTRKTHLINDNHHQLIWAYDPC